LNLFNDRQFINPTSSTLMIKKMEDEWRDSHKPHGWLK